MTADVAAVLGNVIAGQAGGDLLSVFQRADSPLKLLVGRTQVSAAKRNVLSLKQSLNVKRM